MHPLRLLLPGLLLLTGAPASFGQTTPASPAPPASSAAPEEPATEATDKWLLRAGVNAGRAFRYGGYQGAALRLPIAVGAERVLNAKFTLHGQLDSDFRLPRRSPSGDRPLTVPTGALGVGVRYYYNQAGRARHNRAHGPFVGNYLALEARTEVRQLFRTLYEYSPGLNAVWGLQRRLSRSFLLDFNAGVGLGPNANSVGFSYNHSPITLTTHLNLGLYFGR